MQHFSDSDTPDSDEGIRFKTDSTRNKESNQKALDTSRNRRRLSKSRSRSLERRRNRRLDDRDRSFRARSRERSRDRTKYRRRSLSRENRSNSRSRKLRRSRERRSYSRERRIRQKSRDKSKDRNSKYDRSPQRNDKERRSKRSASTDVKNDINKRKKKTDNPKRDSTSEEKLLKSTDSRKSNSKESDIKKTCTKDKHFNATTSVSQEQDQMCLDITEAMDKALASPNNDIVMFGPALPPKLLSNNDTNSDKSNSASPRRHCKHKKSKKHVQNDAKNSEQPDLVIDDVVILEEHDDSGRSKRTDTRTFSKVSTSPISSEDNNSVPDDGVDDGEIYGPVLSNLPESDDKFVIEIEDSDVETENNTYAPVIPERNERKIHHSSGNDYHGPDILLRESEDIKPRTTNSVGPLLPEDLRQKLLENADENGTANISISDDEIEEGEIVGPILPGSKASFSGSQIALEERAVQYKIDRLASSNTGPDVHAREDWMLSLPEAASAAKMGLGPRQFRAKAGPDMSDRSGWTDTPKDREAKQMSSKSTKEVNAADFKADGEKLEMEERDKEQERMARKHKKHRKKDKKDKSLLELHQDKLEAKNKNDDGKQVTRRPFNRDTDLKVNQFDDAQKKAIYKKAQLLDDRFSKGESKYL